MAITTINVGNSPNDGSGDSIRAAFQKANDNFNYLQTQLGNLALAGTNGLTVTGPVNITSIANPILATGVFRLRATTADPYYDVQTTNQTFGGGTVAGVTNFTNAQESASTNTGAVTVAGGFGVQGNTYLSAATITGNLSVVNVNLSGAGQFTLPDGSPFAFDVFANAATQANQIDSKAPKASPILTGEPKSVTFLPGVSNTTIATTAFVAEANAGVSAYTIYTLNLYASYANAVIQPLDANVASYQTWANANLAIANISINNRANIANPTFTGTPEAPTASAGTNTTQLATTAFVFEANTGLRANVAGNLAALRNDLITNYAPIVSPGFSGTPTADQAAAGTNTNQLANTSFVFEANTGSIAFLLYQLQSNNVSHSANITTANSVINSLSANVGAYQIYANANVGVLFNGNLSTQANIGAYQTWANANISLASVNFTTLDANVGTLFNGNLSTQANIGSYQISASANIGLLFNGNLSTQANIGAYQTWANANISAQSFNPVFYGNTLSITSGNLIALGGNASVWSTGATAKTAAGSGNSAGSPGDYAGKILLDADSLGFWICRQTYNPDSSGDNIWIFIPGNAPI